MIPHWHLSLPRRLGPTPVRLQSPTARILPLRSLAVSCLVNTVDRSGPPH